MADSSCNLCGLVERVLAGGVTETVAALPNCVVVLGQSQQLRGYCIAFARRHATEVHLMGRETARALFDEVLIVGAAVANVVKPLKLNYECLGNQEPHVHWHVFPRFANEPAPKRPVWETPQLLDKYRLENWDERALIDQLQAELKRLGGDAGIDVRFPKPESY